MALIVWPWRAGAAASPSTRRCTRGGGLRWVLIGGFIIPGIAFTAAYVATIGSLRAFPMTDECPRRPRDIRIIGHQWWWEVEYLMGDTSQHFRTANEIHLPTDRPVNIELASADVIHSFWVPRLHGKVDLIPGLVTTSSSRAPQPGTYAGLLRRVLRPAARAHALSGHGRSARRLRGLARAPAAPGRPARHARRPPRARRCSWAAPAPSVTPIQGTRALASAGPDLTHLGSRQTHRGRVAPQGRRDAARLDHERALAEAGRADAAADLVQRTGASRPGRLPGGSRVTNEPNAQVRRASKGNLALMTFGAVASLATIARGAQGESPAETEPGANGVKSEAPGQRAGGGCKDLPSAADLKKLLKEAAAGREVGGLDGGHSEWAAVVDRKGEICAVAVSTDDPTAAWPGSQAIAKAKAYTANAFSTDMVPAVDGASLHDGAAGALAVRRGGRQPLQPGLPADAGGQGRRPQAVRRHDRLRRRRCRCTRARPASGGLGASGDTACADHEMAKRMRDKAGLNPPDGALADDIWFTKTDGPSIFAHPLCKNTWRNGKKIGEEPPASGVLRCARHGVVPRRSPWSTRRADRSQAPREAGLAAPLRVCADPNNMPFSNQQGRRARERAGPAGGRRAGHVGWSTPGTRSGAGSCATRSRPACCDVMLEAPVGYERATETIPYYRSSYVFVSRRDRHIKVRSFDDPALRRLRIGVQIIGDDYANSPPAEALGRRGRRRGRLPGLRRLRPADPLAPIVDAVTSGAVDVAVVWGPTVDGSPSPARCRSASRRSLRRPTALAFADVHRVDGSAARKHQSAAPAGRGHQDAPSRD